MRANISRLWWTFLLAGSIFAQAPTKTTVFVTGTWEPAPLEEVDRSIYSYPLHNASLLFGTVTDALELDSSVQLQSRSAAQADLSIRGGTFEQELILLDGIRLSDAQSSHHNLDIPVPIDAIDRIEILHGSGSTLYGSEAVAGVVDVISSDPPDRAEVRVRSGYGSFRTNEESGFAALAAGLFSEKFSFERELSGGFRDDREYRNMVTASETWLKTRAGLTRLYLSLMDRPFGADQFYGNFNSWERTKTWLATVSQGLGKKTLLTGGFRRHTDLFELFRTNPGYYTNRHRDYTLDAALRRQDSIRHVHVFYGAEFLADHVNSTNLGRRSRNQEALYGDVHFQAGSRASLDAGLREEFYGGGQKIATPAVSGTYWLSSKAKLRASAGRAFRLPNYTDLYYHDPGNVGNPHLQPESAWNYEAGMDLHLTQRVTASATVFERHETNDIDYVRANASEVWTAMNFAHVNFVGVESRVRWEAPHSNLVDVEYSAFHGAAAALNGYQSKYAFNYPTQQGVVAWQKLAARGLLMRARMGVTNQISRPAYVLLDASAAWARYSIKPYVRLTNMADATYQPVYGVFMPGRAVLGGLEWCVWCKN